MHLKIINFFFLLFLVLFNNNPLPANETNTGLVEIEKSNFFFNVELADTKEKRGRGLMFRKYLGLNSGMLFVFPNEEEVSIWMKNTIINLDIIFISEKKIIIDLIENASPMSEKIYTARNTKYVLEINAGLVKSLDINIVDKINIEY